jgi:hypothetical protein
MNCTYNYKQLAGNDIVWIDGVEDLDQATKRVQGLRATNPGDYLL